MEYSHADLGNVAVELNALQCSSSMVLIVLFVDPLEGIRSSARCSPPYLDSNPTLSCNVTDYPAR